MGVERARDGAGLSFCLCQQHTGENKTGGVKGPPGLRVQWVMLCGKENPSGAKAAGKG